MRTFLLISSAAVAMLATGCGRFEKQPTGEKLRSSLPMNLFEATGDDSSPIIVGSGSVHLRQKNNIIYQIDLFHAYINAKGHRAVDVAIGNCPSMNVGGNAVPQPVSAGNCKFGTPRTLTGPWQIDLYTDSGMKVSTLTALDNTELVVFSVADPTTQTLALEDKDDDGHGHDDGEGIVECGLNVDPHGCRISLGAARVSLNADTSSTGGTGALTPPTGGPPPNKIKIRYCTSTAMSCN